MRTGIIDSINLLERAERLSTGVIPSVLFFYIKNMQTRKAEIKKEKV